jgi:hypothetical protein
LHRKESIKKNGIEKLKPHFYGLYRVKRKVGTVAYELDLPQERKIHNVFHVSCLKGTIGQHIMVNKGPPPVDEKGKLILILKEVLKLRERILRNRNIREYLVKWENFPIEDAIWEGEQVLHKT